MIDRISRNFLSYSDYRQSMGSRVAPYENYEKREGIGIQSIFGRQRLISASPYMRQSLETALINGKTASERIGAIYNEHRYIAAHVESSGFPHGPPYKGRHVNLVS